MKLASQLK